MSLACPICPGKKHTRITYDQQLYQWIMTVANNPEMSGVSHSEVSSLVVGSHSWLVEGDHTCSNQPQQLTLSLSSCNSRITV